MTRQDDDREGAKPYKTYKARRPRRSQVDEELAGARPARERSSADGRASRDASASASPPPDDKAYRTYGQSPDDERKAGKPREKKAAGTGPRRRRRFRWWYIPVGAFAVFAIAGVVLTVLAWPGYQKFDRSVDKANKRIDKRTRAALSPDEGWIWRNGTTLLLLGVDSKAGEPARSDTILLMHFDPETHTINQLSIPRDTRVDIPGRGTDKINAAMFWGGSSLAVKTVEQFTGVPINHVMIVNFQGFPRLVNAVGGVDMMVPKTITTTAGSNARTVVYEKGMNHFDGKNAMLYVRIRYADDDFHRASRQQTFVQALQTKIAKPSNITKLPEIGKKFMSGVATDLTTNQILELGYLKWRSSGGKKLVMKGTADYEGGTAYVLPPDEARREKLIRRFLGE
ncbi:MAG TPA: LCP family protein [Thermoleophilia bacterium]|nr:LCP family protein [Thermoleophilia bacterium]